MSVKKVEMFTVVCDNCSKNLMKHGEFSCWSDELSAKEVVMESNWLEEKDKYYCEDCYEYDDEDNLVIKTVLYKQRSL